jgi:hypothetical protein
VANKLQKHTKSRVISPSISRAVTMPLETSGHVDDLWHVSNIGLVITSRYHLCQMALFLTLLGQVCLGKIQKMIFPPENG